MTDKKSVVPRHPEVVRIVMSCIARSGYQIKGPNGYEQNALDLAFFIADELEAALAVLTEMRGDDA